MGKNNISKKKGFKVDVGPVVTASWRGPGMDELGTAEEAEQASDGHRGQELAG